MDTSASRRLAITLCWCLRRQRARAKRWRREARAQARAGGGAPRDCVGNGWHLGQPYQVLQAQVLDVGLAHADEARQQRDARAQQLRVGLQRERERDCLEHHRVLRVVLVHVLVWLAAGDDAAQHGRQRAQHTGVLRRREVLQHAQALDLSRRSRVSADAASKSGRRRAAAPRLQPGRGDAVVVVVSADRGAALGAAALTPIGHQALQQAHHARRQALVALVAARHDAQQQRDQREQHARLRVALVQQRALRARRRPAVGALPGERTARRRGRGRAPAWPPRRPAASPPTRAAPCGSGAAGTARPSCARSAAPRRSSAPRHGAPGVARAGWLRPGRPAAGLGRTSRFMTSSISSAAISCPPTARRNAPQRRFQSAGRATAFDAQRCASAPRRRTVAHKPQREAVEGLVAGDEVVADGVDDQPQELVLLRASAARARPQRPARAYGAVSGAGSGAPRSAGSRRPCSPPASPRTCARRARVTRRRGCRARPAGRAGGAHLVAGIRSAACLCPNSTS